ncbi:MAG: molecular chaperone GrpE [Frankiales bacterium]|nr:molecular chaperone GrpE [Frankiales bacterium]
MTEPISPDDQQHDGPVVRDKRRLDPVTGEVREPATPPAPLGGEPDAGVRAAASEPATDYLADLQRLQAEYANYRRRVERDRQAVAEQALASLLLGLLPVLDDIDRARQHGEVEGGFKVVAEGLEATLTKLGLERYGVAGEPFDPTVHEALLHTTSPDVTEPTAVEILQPGFRLGERILRPARVAVADPEEGQLEAAQPAGPAAE